MELSEEQVQLLYAVLQDAREANRIDRSGGGAVMKRIALQVDGDLCDVLTVLQGYANAHTYALKPAR